MDVYRIMHRIKKKKNAEKTRVKKTPGQFWESRKQETTYKLNKVPYQKSLNSKISPSIVESNKLSSGQTCQLFIKENSK